MREEQISLLSVLKNSMQPAGKERIAMALARLQPHFWRPEFSKAKAKAFYEDNIEDLSGLPLDILEEATRCYRRDPDAKFFPRSGVLLGIARPMVEERKRAIVRLERLLSESTPQPEKKHTPESIARVKAAAANLFKRPDAAPLNHRREGDISDHG